MDQQDIKAISKSFDLHTQDIKNVLQKDWLIPAAVSHVAIDTGLPEMMGRKVINQIYQSEY